MQALKTQKYFLDSARLFGRRAERAARLLSRLPFVRLIGLNGSLVLGTAHRGSDIDFLIISEPGRIFTVRVMTASLLKLFRLLRTDQDFAGRICPNRYQTTGFLEIKPNDDYHARYFSALVPLYDERDRYYNQYAKANFWMESNFSKLVAPSLNLPKLTKRGFFKMVLELFLAGPIGNRLEALFERKQRSRVAADSRTKSAPTNRIRLSKDELCFHPLKETKF